MTERSFSYKSVLFSLARSPLLRPLVGFVFAMIPFALPVERLVETPHWLAFFHPRPSYPLHILLVPKRAVASLKDLRPEDAPLLGEMVDVVQQLVARFNLETRGYRLITNGGPNQDIPQLHWHLISEVKP
ncbi:MAG TPA: HIT domain-containing protein [Anaerolineaceae bacterium]|mgnify:CR=1 FL=1|nr:HIT domain-containing protein [Anaerolineaceae bacterium]HPN53421.1 HIT domain-containing protein [Anaerolineaceae bacterium]